MIRPCPPNGPRSLMRTTTLLPFLVLVTRTRVPSGSERCAAVIACLSKRSPDAVICDSPYHDA